MECTRVLYTRREHGSVPVWVLVGAEGVRYQLGGEQYRSVRGLMERLYGRRTGLTLRQYFGAQWAEATPGTLEMFGCPPPVEPAQTGQTLVLQSGERVRCRKRAEGVRPCISTTRLFRSTEPAVPVLGIDLDKRGIEVKRILHKCFGWRIFRQGYDTQDILQEVYRGLLVRNLGKCPWDARKSSFSHYVYMVISCVLANYQKQRQRILSKERQDRMVTRDGDEVLRSDLQAAERGLEVAPPQVPDMRNQLEGLVRPDELDSAEQVCGLILQGHSKTEASRRTGWPVNRVNGLMRVLAGQSTL